MSLGNKPHDAPALPARAAPEGGAPEPGTRPDAVTAPASPAVNPARMAVAGDGPDGAVPHPGPPDAPRMALVPDPLPAKDAPPSTGMPGTADDRADGHADHPVDHPVDHPSDHPLGEAVLRLAEALVFSSAAPVSARTLAQLLPPEQDADAVIEALRARYAGRGMELVDVAGGVQFRTAPDLAGQWRKVIEVPRRLTRVAMETLAIIAYHQPVTRGEIEQLRGTSLSQQTLESLLEVKLVAPAGRKEVPGRPTLWATTPEFLMQFGLKDVRSLPRREDLFLEPPRPAEAARAEAPSAADPAPSAALDLFDQVHEDPAMGQVSPSPGGFARAGQGDGG